MCLKHVARQVMLVALIGSAIAFSPAATMAQGGFEGWHLEPGIAKAHLVMVARVASISQLTIVEGAKTDVAHREYRFQPIRRLKGIFQRDQLSMTAADLGCVADEGTRSCPLKEGEYRLLVLAQQQGQTYGCVSAGTKGMTFGERVPLLDGPDDPLVAVVETLIRVVDSNSRRERAKLLVDRLEGTTGLAVVPILSSLKLRADWGAREPAALASLSRLALDTSPAVSGGAIEALRDILGHRPQTGGPVPLQTVSEALREILRTDEARTRIRVAALEALGILHALGHASPETQDILQSHLKSGATFAERTAAATALSRVQDPAAAAAVSAAFDALPLDEPPARELILARAVIRLTPQDAERLLLSRMERSIRARQSLDAEIESLGRIQSGAAVPLLLEAARQSQSIPVEPQRIAGALGRLRDDRALQVLARWLRNADFNTRDAVLTALENLDSEAVAREVRGTLKSEPHLPYKLRIARILARHGIADGYALATEHLADDQQTGAATLVLASLNDGRTANDLSAILASRPDRRWHAAALSGLAATGDVEARRQLLTILNDDRHPLALQATEAAGLAGDPELVRPLAPLIQSRNRNLARAALLAVRRFFSDVRTSPRGLEAVDLDRDALRPDAVHVAAETRTAIATSAAALLTDAYVDLDLRLEAVKVARLLDGEFNDDLFLAVADQSELEGTPLLPAVLAELQRRRRAEQ
jgi:hypothetical protein